MTHNSGWQLAIGFWPVTRFLATEKLGLPRRLKQMALVLAQLPAVNQLWYVVPLIVTISLVYGATRHELMGPILRNAVRAATWIVGFMAIIFFVLLGVSWFL